MSTQPTTPLLGLSRGLSFVFHPIWLPLVFAAWQAWGDPELPKLLLLVFLFVIAFPGCVAMLWMWLRKEKDWFVMAQANRLVPLVASLLGLAFFAVANESLLPERLFQGELMATLILLVGISILVNLFWKISVHMMSWGAVVAFTAHAAWISGSWLFLALAFMISGAVAWARIHVGSHDRAQVIVGWFVGIIAATFIIALFS